MYLIRGRNERKSERAVYRPAKTEVNNRDKSVARSAGVWGVSAPKARVPGRADQNGT
ncbi:hypothetical protein [Xanthomonas hortorum]|uniref:Uncharacterized protein n=1 Tax=Xanthomonas hortorum pv. hederae TaxID=453603 RepID=A0A9X4BWA4_9XANT|nr:hypothetical protein [Xanthomonas hortorum]MDC8640789.1 hypothetical protein [Xanthomonas hortorum pv. hederae]